MSENEREALVIGQRGYGGANLVALLGCVSLFGSVTCRGDGFVRRSVVVQRRYEAEALAATVVGAGVCSDAV